MRAHPASFWGPSEPWAALGSEACGRDDGAACGWQAGFWWQTLAPAQISNLPSACLFQQQLKPAGGEGGPASSPRPAGHFPKPARTRGGNKPWHPVRLRETASAIPCVPQHGDSDPPGICPSRPLPYPISATSLGTLAPTHPFCKDLLPLRAGTGEG